MLVYEWWDNLGSGHFLDLLGHTPDIKSKTLTPFSGFRLLFKAGDLSKLKTTGRLLKLFHESLPENEGYLTTSGRKTWKTWMEASIILILACADWWQASHSLHLWWDSWAFCRLLRVDAQCHPNISKPIRINNQFAGEIQLNLVPV